MYDFKKRKMMNKTLLNTLCIISLLTTVSLYAKTSVELWNQSKTPFYIALLDGNLKYILPKANKGEQANPQKPIKLQELKYSDKKDKNGRISLNNVDIASNAIGGASLLVSDKIEPSLEEWKTIPAYVFSKNKDIFVRIKDNVENLEQLTKNGLGPQAGPWKGLKGKTETGLSLSNNVKKDDIMKFTSSGTFWSVYARGKIPRAPRQKLDPIPTTTDPFEFFGLSRESITKEKALATFHKLLKDRNLLEIDLSRRQHRDREIIYETYFDLEDLLSRGKIPKASPQRLDDLPSTTNPFEFFGLSKESTTKENALAAFHKLLKDRNLLQFDLSRRQYREYEIIYETYEDLLDLL